MSQLFQFLSNLVSNWWNTFRQVVTKVVVAILAFFVALMVEWFQLLRESVEAIAALFTDFVFPEVGLEIPSAVMQGIAVANTVAPISEMFGYLILWGGLAGVLSLYRFLKSWLPIFGT